MPHLGAIRKPKNVTYVLSLIVAALGLRIGEALAIKVPTTSAARTARRLSRENAARHYVLRGLPRSARSAERVHQDVKTTKDQNGIRDVDVPESLAAVLKEYVAGRKSGKLLFVSREGNPLLQRNINRDWLHRILEKVGLRKVERWRGEDGRRRVKCLKGDGTAWHAMRRFRCTHLETELIPNR